jgi:hypothetical protein
MTPNEPKRFAGVLIVATLLGCSSLPSESDPGDAGTDVLTDAQELCSGGTTLSLAYQLYLGGPVSHGEQFLDQNGRRFLFINANCEYWLSGFDDDDGWHAAWSEVRHGVLDAEDAAELEAAVAYRAWRDSQLRIPACDGPTVIATNGHEAMLRVSGCGGEVPEGDSRVKEVHDALDQFASQLWPKTEPISSAIRFRAIHVAAGQLGDRPPAPLSFDVAPFSVDEMDDIVLGANAPSFVFADTAVLIELRELRDQLLAGAFRTFEHQPILLGTVQQGETYILAFRDVLPFEDATGFVGSSAFGVE